MRLILILVLVTLAACQTANTRRQQYVDQNHTHMTARMQNIITQGKFCVGMTKNQLRASLGRPVRVNITSSRLGRREQWIYHPSMFKDGPKLYIYLDDGIVTAFQK